MSDYFADPFPNAPGAASAATASRSSSKRGARREQDSVRSSGSKDSRYGLDEARKDEPAIFNSVVVTERLGMLAVFEEQYRQKAADLRDQSRQSLKQEAEAIVLREERASKEKAASRNLHPDVTALEGEILQECVLAEQLRATEEQKESQVQELAQASKARVSSRPPKPGQSPSAQLREALREADLGMANAPTGDQLREEVEKERSMLEHLQQKAWRAKNAVRASEAHEDLLQAHRKDLERKLSEAQAQVAWLTSSQDGDEPGVVTEAHQLKALRKREAAMAERARSSEAEEQAAHQAVTLREHNMQDLEVDVHALCEEASLGGGPNSQEARQVHALLCASLPPLPGSGGAFPATLEPLLDKLDGMRQSVRAELQIDTEKGSAWQSREEDRLAQMAKEISDLNHEAEQNTEEMARLQAQRKALPHATADVEDRLCEASDLRRENDVMRRQQSQWQRAELRMLRLIEDMQRFRYRDVQTQATVAARLEELQRQLPLQDLAIGNGSGHVGKNSGPSPSYPSSRSPSPPKSRDLWGSPGAAEVYSRGTLSVDAIWSDNVAMQSKLRRLEEERDELVKSQESLIQLVKSKMPTIEQARSNMRFAHAVGEPHFQRRAVGY